MRTGIIYLITSPSGKRYIGKTVQTLEARWQGHKKCAASGVRTPLYCAIRKYGVNSFLLEELCSVPVDWLNAAEIAFIKLLGTFGKGYNATPGGDGMPAGEEHPFFGKKATAEHRANLSRAHKGRKLSAEQRKHLSLINTGKKLTPEACAKIGAKSKGNRYAAGSKGHIGLKRTGCSSLFYGLTKVRNKWRVNFNLDGKMNHVGYFSTELEAAQAYNDYIVTNGINRPLNVFEEIYEQAS